MAIFFMIFLIVCVLLLVIVTLSTVYVVRQQSVAIIERFGKYQKVANSGIHIRLPFGIDSIAARIQLRLLQSDIVVETKTKDNVFVMMNVATQYRVNEQSVTDAYYKLIRPESQIKSYIEDALRSSVPKLTLDELFEKKDEIALEVQHQVAEEMTTYGYIIVKTLITKVEPDAEVKQSMNEINAAQRKRGSQHKNWRKLTRLKLSLQLKQKQKKTAFMVWGLPNNVRRLWMDWQSLSPNSRKPMLA